MQVTINNYQRYFVTSKPIEGIETLPCLELDIKQ
jgi:hypothetical protein